MHWITLPLVLIIGAFDMLANRGEHDPDLDTIEPHPAAQ